jgi:hypothetical protein
MVDKYRIKWHYLSRGSEPPSPSPENWGRSIALSILYISYYNISLSWILRLFGDDSPKICHDSRLRKTGFGPEAPHILGHLSCITWTAMGKPLGFLRSAVPWTPWIISDNGISRSEAAKIHGQSHCCGLSCVVSSPGPKLSEPNLRNPEDQDYQDRPIPHPHPTHPSTARPSGSDQADRKHWLPSCTTSHGL